ncbi:MAG: 50S ribosomal protein L11 methyltransferase [Chitinophagaceae bacterium]|nr:50S ribosomal protein L11 methyltransferase [Chitinophagaceae bacterium]MCW5927542.1 50S ribosomal protein L11 methyltransferase [Chitinophagaceae bacterium]
MNEVFVEITVYGEAGKLETVLAQLNEVVEVAGVEELDDHWKIYLAAADFNENICREIFDINGIKYSISNINNRNWNEIWESGFDPVVVNDFVAVRAEFHPPVSGVAHEVVITPKMSFGTGHHATTHMMLEMLRTFSPHDKEVVDFGTGTGLLAILAARLGASKVTAIDYDTWSIDNALENFEKNNTPGIILLQLDHFPEGFTADMVLANINRNVIVDNFPAITRGVANGGILILSGIMDSDISDIQLVAETNGFAKQLQLLKNKWACLSFRKLIKA